MFPAMSDDDRRSFRAMLERPLRSAVKEAAKLDDPADLEQLSGDIVPAGLLATMPGAAAEAIAAIADVPGALTLDVGEPVSSVMVECRRPGATCSQVLCFTLEWPLRAYPGRILWLGVERPVERSSCHSIRRLCDGLHGQ